MNNLLTFGINRLIKIYPEVEFKNTHFQKLISEKDVENYHFYNSEPVFRKNIEIPVKDIVGTNHLNYQNLSWIEMLGSFNRSIKDNYRDTIEFIYSDKVPGKKAVTKYGDKYIIFCGNHRLCYTKLLNIAKITVDVNEYNIDEHKYQLFQRFGRTGIKIDKVSFCSEVCNFFINSIEVICHGFNGIEKFLELYDSVIIKESILNRKKLLRNSKTSKDRIFITNQEDIPLLISEIKRYKILNFT